MTWKELKKRMLELEKKNLINNDTELFIGTWSANGGENWRTHFPIFETQENVLKKNNHLMIFHFDQCTAFKVSDAEIYNL